MILQNGNSKFLNRIGFFKSFKSLHMFVSGQIMENVFSIRTPIECNLFGIVDC